MLLKHKEITASYNSDPGSHTSRTLRAQAFVTCLSTEVAIPGAVVFHFDSEHMRRDAALCAVLLNRLGAEEAIRKDSDENNTNFRCKPPGVSLSPTSESERV